MSKKQPNLANDLILYLVVAVLGIMFALCAVLGMDLRFMIDQVYDMLFPLM